MKHYILAAFILLSKLHFSQADECTNALLLTDLTNHCSVSTPYTNVGSTPSSVSNASCWPVGTYNDVWFKFVCVGTDLYLNLKNGTIPMHSMALFSGSCNSLTLIACASSNLSSQIYQSGLTIGVTYYIKIGSSVGDGTFDLCINNSFMQPAGSDCNLAGRLCNKNTVNVDVLNGAGNNPNEGIGSCLDVSGVSTLENNSKWFYWTCKSSGTLTFDIKPLDIGSDIDFVLYQLNSADPCVGQSILRCNASSCLNPYNGATGLDMASLDVNEVSGCDALTQDAYVQYISMIAGTSYALLINNFDGLSGFDIEFGGTGTFVGPDPVISINKSVFCTNELTIFNGSNSDFYQGFNWYLPNANPNTSTSIITENILYTSPGVYTAILTATDAIGCVNADYKNITVNHCEIETINPLVSIPNVFTPNNDNINDVFRVKSTGLKDLNVLIFNRWGQKIYTISGINGSWDGYDCSEGTYYYVLSATDANDKLIENKGDITLLR